MSELSTESSDLQAEIHTWYTCMGKITLRAVGILPEMEALDFGCGPGRFTVPLAQACFPHGTVHALDRRSEPLEELAERLAVFAPDSRVCLHCEESGDLRELFAPKSLDVVFLFDVLQHVPDRRALFEQLAQILRTDGRIFLYPAAQPHPGRVDMSAVSAELARSGFGFFWWKDLRIPHSHEMVDDRIYVFSRDGG